MLSPTREELPAAETTQEIRGPTSPPLWALRDVPWSTRPRVGHWRHSNNQILSPHHPPEISLLNNCQHVMDFGDVMTYETNPRGASYRQAPCLLLTDTVTFNPTEGRSLSSRY